MIEQVKPLSKEERSAGQIVAEVCNRLRIDEIKNSLAAEVSAIARKLVIQLFRPLKKQHRLIRNHVKSCEAMLISLEDKV